MSVMDIAELMRQLADADERRRDAEPGSTTQRDAEVEVERLAGLIEVASDGELVISRGVPMFVAVSRSSR
jgi:hypothetical protein